MARHISFIRTLNIRPLLAVVVPLRIPATMLSKVKRETLATPSIAVPFPHKEMNTDLIGSKKTIIRTLEQMLNINTFEALDLYFKNKDLSNVSSSSLKSIHNIYLDYSVNNETLIKYPELLTLDAKTLERKLIILKDLPYDINETVMLCLLSMDTLPVFVKLELKNKGRIENLRKILELDVEETCVSIARRPFLCFREIAKIEDSVKLLRDYGINLESIVRDLWVLKYNNSTMKIRFDQAKAYNVEELKTWMVRAQPEIFQTYIQRRTEKKTILGDNSLTEYLSERLQCSETVAQSLIRKHPALANKSLKKLKELIDFLYSVGFQSHHICRIPKILAHSVETISKRLKELEEQGIRLDSLHILTKSQKQYKQYYDALLKCKNKQK